MDTVRLGIAGAIGTGKTALVWRLCQRPRERLSLAVITNDIYTQEDAEVLAWLEPHLAGRPAAVVR